MSYHGSLTQIRAATERDVTRAWRAYGLGRISRQQFVQFAAGIITEGYARAATLGDLSSAAQLTRVAGVIHSPTGRLPRGYNPDLFAEGLTTLLAAHDAGEDVTARLGRFALNAPVDAAQDAYGHGIEKSKHIEGWVRGLDADPCQLCRWWWREGQIWPKNHAMPFHKGCTCTPVPVTKEKTA